MAYDENVSCRETGDAKHATKLSTIGQVQWRNVGRFVLRVCQVWLAVASSTKDSGNNYRKTNVTRKDKVERITVG